MHDNAILVRVKIRNYSVFSLKIPMLCSNVQFHNILAKKKQMSYYKYGWIETHC